MPATPERILAYLKDQPESSAPQIARALGLTVQNIRHHIHRLEAEGWLEGFQRSDSSRPGRPATVYQLNPARLPNRLADLAGAALNLLLQNAQPDTRQSVLRALASALLPALPAAGGHLTHRLNEAVRILNRSNYEAHWEARAGGPRLFLDSCPFAQVVNDHPEICEMECYLVEQLIGQPVAHLACRGQPSARPAACCVFQVVEGGTQRSN